MSAAAPVAVTRAVEYPASTPMRRHSSAGPGLADAPVPHEHHAARLAVGQRGGNGGELRPAAGEPSTTHVR
jgi:hypothetical protein